MKRPNKQAQGMFDTYRRSQTNRITIGKDNQSFNRLVTHGTCDKLIGGNRFYCKKIKKEHPIDKGYFKEVYILTDMGRNKLNRLKQ